ncbi:2-hydroxyacyl-CoA dehydratase, partial [Anaerosalibacter bizertensis]|nr:2-hydroxyacyl-CoA dehydratase [Anaerosalibacter bizertensis]
LNMNLVSKLMSNNIKVITPEMINKDKINRYSNKLPKRMFWTHGKKIVGSAFSLIKEQKIDGIIYLSSFGCGMDSVLVDLVERKAIKEEIPFTLLTLDEQTGEAGINTRIEAFIDMMKWRNRDENNISAFR